MILDIQPRGTAAWLWMNRPEARNALSDELLAALETALDVLEKDAAARVLVLAGRGPAFCAGGDLARMEKAAKMTKSRLSAPGPYRSGRRRVPRPTICQNLVWEWTGLKKTRFTTSGTSIPVSSMSTEMAMCGGLSASEKASISDWA